MREKKLPSLQLLRPVEEIQFTSKYCIDSSILNSRLLLYQLKGNKQVLYGFCLKTSQLIFSEPAVSFFAVMPNSCVILIQNKIKLRALDPISHKIMDVGESEQDCTKVLNWRGKLAILTSRGQLLVLQNGELRSLGLPEKIRDAVLVHSDHILLIYKDNLVYKFKDSLELWYSNSQKLGLHFGYPKAALQNFVFIYQGRSLYRLDAGQALCQTYQRFESPWVIQSLKETGCRQGLIVLNNKVLRVTLDQ